MMEQDYVYQERSPESVNGDMEASTSERFHKLSECFRKLDLDGSGFIEFHELRRMAKQATPKVNLDDTHDMLKIVDKNEDSKISLEEFMDVMGPMTEPMGDEEFAALVEAIMQDRADEALNEPGYKHPAGCREYLAAEVLPTLHQGLLELAKVVEADRLSLAGGELWEEGQYLPVGWAPFSALRWLGKWILANRPNAGEEGPEESGPPPRSFTELSREDKVALAFKHLDRDNSGFLDASELLAIAGKLRKDQDLAMAKNLLQSMDLDQNGTVEMNEYIQFVLHFTDVLSEQEFDAAMHRVLGANHLSYCTSRQDKLRFLFQELDADRTGVLSMEEVAQLAKRMDPEATPWRIQATMEFLDRDGSHGVDQEEFVTAMTRLLSHLREDADLDTLIINLLEGRKVGALAPADPTDEVEPAALQDLARAIPSSPYVLQVSTTEVMDVLSGHGVPMVLVDVRNDEEVAVSALPGALHLPAVQDSSEEHGWAVGDLEPLKERIQVVTVQHGGMPRVVVYDSTGATATPVAVYLSKRLSINVRNLCGGIINYYNQGGRVRDASGREVQAVHPGSRDHKAFIERPNTFKLVA